MTASDPTEIKDWSRLTRLIREYTQAAINDSWKGGGDPDDIPAIEADKRRAQARLRQHIAKMKKEINTHVRLGLRIT